MTTSTRIDPQAVCTLPPEALDERLDWIRREILPHATRRESGPDQVSWELAEAPGLGPALDRLVALERDCCSEIRFEHQTTASGRRRLVVRGVDPRAPIFSPDPPGPEAGAGPKHRLGARIARALGVGTALGLLICCALPIGAAVLVGGVVAAPLASLDQPWIIAAASLLAAGGVFAWQGRRPKPTAKLEDAGAASPRAPGCR